MFEDETGRRYWLYRQGLWKRSPAGLVHHELAVEQRQ
jgi:hypothetical protein